jgi:hypothetical protein
MRLVIGLFKVNTQATQYLSPASRVRNVSAAIEETKSYTESLNTAFWQEPSALRAVFLAPEYCFARSLPNHMGDHAFGTKRQMEEDYVRNSLRPTFAGLSRNFQNALIVPGTVAWRKSIMPATTNKHASPQAAATARKSKYEQRIQDSANVNMLHYRDPDDIYSHNYPFTSNTTVFPNAFKRPDDPRASVQTIADKVTALRTTAHYIAKNTAHCYYNGDCVYRYNKIGDFYEVSDADPSTVMMPNRSTVSGVTVGPGRFRVANLDFGISVCYDQSLSIQKTAPVEILEPLQSSGIAVDFHLLLSASITPQMSNNNLKSEGYLLSCSSAEDCNQVLPAKGAKLTRNKEVPINNAANLDLYVLEKPPKGTLLAK